MKKIYLSAIAAILFATGVAQIIPISSATAQSGYRSRGGNYGGGSRGSTNRGGAQGFSEIQPPRRLSFEDRFWKWLKQAQYENWAPWPGQGAGEYEGQSPHGAFLKMYINRSAAADPKSPPHGSVIIKENYGPDRKKLMAVTVMYRVKDYDPQHGDWYWVKYNPNGTVAKKGDMRLAGKVKGCIDCHSGADGGDLIFAND